ncbi:MAG: hypothetical protein V4469_02325 [Patescibacteria group bacterium]
MREHKEDKIRFLEELQKIGNVWTACGRIKIPRSTIYRWLKTDPEFNELARKAMKIGRISLSEMTEGVVIKKAIVEKDLKASMYILSHNHPRYIKREPLPPKDENQAMNLADLIKKSIKKDGTNEDSFGL